MGGKKFPPITYSVNLLTMPTNRIPWGTNCGCAAHDYMLLAMSMPLALIVTRYSFNVNRFNPSNR